MRPSRWPASIGPPLTMTAGTLRRMAAISMPGTILSQHGTSTSASKAWAMVMDSTRVGDELAAGQRVVHAARGSWRCRRRCPSRRTRSGVPPALRTPALTASTTLRRCMCPGTTSLNELAMPMNGRSISASLTPSARSSERCGARATPRLISSLLTVATAFLERTGGRDAVRDREASIIPEASRAERASAVGRRFGGLSLRAGMVGT